MGAGSADGCPVCSKKLRDHKGRPEAKEFCRPLGAQPRGGGKKGKGKGKGGAKGPQPKAAPKGKPSPAKPRGGRPDGHFVAAEDSINNLCGWIGPVLRKGDAITELMTWATDKIHGKNRKNLNGSLDQLFNASRSPINSL